jgi:tetratricopeptide (TPR) repeat protein
MKKVLSHLGVIVFLAALVYLNSFQADFHLDDFPHIVDNQRIKQAGDLGAIWGHWPSRFVCFYTFALNYAAGRLKPEGYHAVNLLIHLLSAVFAYFLVLHLPRREESSGRIDIREVAFWAALLFAVHPVQTQSVTYIVQRCASLAGCLSFLALLCYFRSRGMIGRGARFWSAAHVLPYAGGLIAGVLAMGSKESAVAVPLLIAAWEILSRGLRGMFKLDAIRQMAPYLALILVVPVLTLITARAERAETSFYYRLNRGFAIPRFNLIAQDQVLASRGEYLCTQINVVRTYLRLCFFPFRQTIYHDIPVARSVLEIPTALSAALVLSLVVVGFRARRRTLIAGSVAWFFLSLIPTSSVMVIWPFLSEHHLYLPLFGWSLAMAVGLERICRHRPSRRALAWSIAISLAALTIYRNEIWRNADRLWTDAWKKYPDCAAVNNSLSGALISRDARAAATAARRAMELNPRLDAWRNLWAAYFNLGELQEAEKAAREHVARYPARARPHISLGMTLIKRGDLPGAIASLQRALAIDPLSFDARFYLGMARYQSGDAAAAAGDLAEAVRLNPDLVSAHNYLGLARTRLGQPAEAEAAFREGLQASPGDLSLNYNLGLLLWGAGRKDEAEAHLARSLTAAGDTPTAAGIAKALRTLRGDLPPQ